MSYEDDEIEIHMRRGRASPEYRAPRRPVYYERHAGGRLEVAGSRYVERSRSRDRHRPVSPAPIIINNRIHNEYDYEEEDPRHYLAMASPARGHSRSRQRDSRDGYPSRDDYELERTRKELEAFRMEKQREEDERLYKKEVELKRLRDARQREEDEKLYKKEMELKRLREEKRAEEEKKRAKAEAEKAVKDWQMREEEEKKRAKAEADKAIKDWQTKENEKKEKEKKEKEEREKEYKKRLEEDLRKSGIDDRQIAVILKKEKEIDPSRPTYTRMARRYLSIETLNAFRIDYTYDQDPEYILIKRWVPEYEQDFLWNHTKEIRDRRERPGPVILAIEEKKHHHYHDSEYEFVRKKEHKRSKSPSPLITFLAGGKGR